MKKNLFIGIDFSKATFDVSMIHGADLDTTKHKQFANVQTGYEEMLEWVKKQTWYRRLGRPNNLLPL